MTSVTHNFPFRANDLFSELGHVLCLCYLYFCQSFIDDCQVITLTHVFSCCASDQSIDTFYTFVMYSFANRCWMTVRWNCHSCLIMLSKQSFLRCMKVFMHLFFIDLLHVAGWRSADSCLSCLPLLSEWSLLRNLTVSTLYFIVLLIVAGWLSYGINCIEV